MELRCPECASYLANDLQIGKNQGKIRWVVAFNLAMMVGEIATGYLTGSMALVAEGWHMGSHVGALSITLLAYRLAKSPKLSQQLSFGAGKLIPLGGYTSAVILAIVALFVLIESVGRLFSPVSIAFDEAIEIALVGLVVNVVGAIILHGGHAHGHVHHAPEGDHDDEPDHDHRQAHVHDHNIRSAFLHIVADAVTSLLAVFALLFGKLYHWVWLDPVIGITGAFVIFSWAFQLCRDTGWELLDGHSRTIDWRKLKEAVERDGTRILDFHVWRIAPTAVACELVVSARTPRGLEHYREILREKFSVQHIVVEERPQ
jgi:cation diffusion facilitator family transporter